MGDKTNIEVDCDAKAIHLINRLFKTLKNHSPIIINTLLLLPHFGHIL